MEMTLQERLAALEQARVEEARERPTMSRAGRIF
jgi:hypothetical protein